MNVVAQLKGIVKNVQNTGSDKIYGIANEYQTKNGCVVVVGFTSYNAYVINLSGMDDVETESGYADMSLWKQAIKLWIKGEKKLLDAICDYEDVDVVMEFDKVKGGLVPTTLGMELFDDETLSAIQKKATRVYELISGEEDCDPNKIPQLMKQL